MSNVTKGVCGPERPYDSRHEAERDAGLKGNEITIFLIYNKSFFFLPKPPRQCLAIIYKYLEE